MKREYKPAIQRAIANIWRWIISARWSAPAIIAVIILPPCLALLSGCANYRLGRHAEPPFRSIYIKPVANESFAPRAQALLTSQIADIFARDGLVQVATVENAEAILEVTLIDFERHITATRADDTAIASKLRLELVANCTLIDGRNGRVFFENRRITASAGAFPGEAGLQSEFQEMPVLTRNLARRIAHEVLQVW